MKLSVLLTTYNRRGVLADTFPTLLQQDFPPDQYEIVVVVDGSTDGSAELLRSFPKPCAVQIIEQDNAGQVAAQNVGLRAARGDIVLFMDDEVLSTPGLLREHVAAHAQGGPYAVFGPVKLADESPDTIASDWTERWFNTYSEAPGGAIAARPPYTQVPMVSPNSSLPRDTLLACGQFDERFGYLQDLEFGLRLREHGVRPCFRPAAVAYQICVKSDAQLIAKDAVGQGRDYLRLARRHPGYRRNLPLSRLGHGPGPRRLAWHAAASFPGATETLLRAPYWTTERLRRIPAMRRAGLRLLGYRRFARVLHSAAEEAGSWPALLTEFGARLPALLYHHVGPRRAGTNPTLTVAPREFESQIRWLSEKGFTGITSSQWLAWCENGARLPSRPVLVTFDDAYADLDEHALPVLRRYGFSGAVFVVTACMGKKSAWDEPAGWVVHDCMSEERIRYWSEQGIEFGAHGHTHADLTRLSESELRRELQTTGQELERVVGKRPVAFAYPYGRHNDTVRARVGEQFPISFTIEPGVNELGTDLSRLHRSSVFPGDTRLDLLGRLRWGKSPIRGLRGRLQHLLSPSAM